MLRAHQHHDGLLGVRLGEQPAARLLERRRGPSPQEVQAFQTWTGDLALGDLLELCRRQARRRARGER